MRKIFATVAVLLAVVVYAGMANADELFKATLTGDQEVPPVITDTTGKAFFRRVTAASASDRRGRGGTNAIDTDCNRGHCAL